MLSNKFWVTLKGGMEVVTFGVGNYYYYFVRDKQAKANP
jgi:hypothetical protein